jgi:catechol 2,3-dioxygenase-like lactoylglutathione lyase family enzyme
MTLKKRESVPEFYISDIGVSRAFYTNVLGFDVTCEQPEDRLVYLSREGAELMLDTVYKGRTWLTASLEETVPHRRGARR